MLSGKKIFAFSEKINVSIDDLTACLSKYSKCFKVHRYDNTPTALNYVKGLFRCIKGQANMERMEEEIEQSEYRAYQQFISNSNWDRDGLSAQVAIESSMMLNSHAQVSGKPTGYIIDESAHLKKGKKSVGVARQYAGVIGKVDNCQVGVYSSLVNHKYATIVNRRLFLPESWTNDRERCLASGVPLEYIQFKTKPELALEMLKEDIERGLTFDWVGGDGLYGHNHQLCNGLDELNQFFVLDIHKDEKVYVEEAKIEVPQKKEGRGRIPKNKQAIGESIRVDKLKDSLSQQDWKLEYIRDTVQGKLSLHICKKEVWVWDGKEDRARKRTLVITKTNDQTVKTKYSISNGGLDDYSHGQYAYFVAQRYWVERTFDNAKNELGMSDYQIRGWKAWNSHMSLVMLASQFITRQMIDNQQEMPLMSFSDARILVILYFFSDQETIELRLEQMKKRQNKRQKDIDQKYRKQSEFQSFKSS